LKTGANFSTDKKYRYTLWRVWNEDKPLLGFCMLNPSTANEEVNDPTVARCQRRAELWSYGGVIVTNIFALRSTDPSALKTVIDPVGPMNDVRMIGALQQCETIICGWGKHGSLNGRGNEVLESLIAFFGNNRVRALRINKDGSPAHPLYIGYDVQPIPIDFKSR
jgi:hypothetical protein